MSKPLGLEPLEICFERRADSPSCCFFEKRSERRERLERAFMRPKAGARSSLTIDTLHVSLTSDTRTRQLLNLKGGLLPHDAALESPLAAVDDFGSNLVANSAFWAGFSRLRRS